MAAARPRSFPRSLPSRPKRRGRPLRRRDDFRSRLRNQCGNPRRARAAVFRARGDTRCVPAKPADFRAARLADRLRSIWRWRRSRPVKRAIGPNPASPSLWRTPRNPARILPAIATRDRRGAGWCPNEIDALRRTPREPAGARRTRRGSASEMLCGRAPGAWPLRETLRAAAFFSWGLARSASEKNYANRLAELRFQVVRKYRTGYICLHWGGSRKRNSFEGGSENDFLRRGAAWAAPWPTEKDASYV